MALRNPSPPERQVLALAASILSTANRPRSRSSLARSFPFQTLVAVYNDFSLDNDFIYTPSANDPQNRQVRRGVSIMGWSYSLDVGKTWTYQGKIHPPTGWSAIWGDPSIAVDPNNRNIVYYAQMGATTTSWDAVTGGANITDLSPGRDMVDGFCIARSTNGGIDFSEVVCKKVGNGPATVDRTAVTVDGLGRVYVALNRVAGGVQTGTAVFRSEMANWKQFAPLPDPSISSLSEPHLTTDTDGDVWFGSRDNRGEIGGDVSIMRFRQNAVSWDHFIHAASTCFLSLGDRDPPYAGQSRKLRNGHTYSFAVGLEEQRPDIGAGLPPRRKVIRVAF